MNQQQDMTTDEFYFPLITKVSISFFFPFEVIDACLVSTFPNLTSSSSSYITDQPLMSSDGSHPSTQGIFTFDSKTHQGMWSFDPASIMKDDQDSSCERVILKGTLKVQNTSLDQLSA
jgi:hypothetical protein